MLSNLPFLWARMLDNLPGWENMHIFGGKRTWNGWKTDVMLHGGPQQIQKARDFISAADVVIFYGHAHPRRLIGPMNIGPLLKKKTVVQVLAVDPFLIWKPNFPLNLWRGCLGQAHKIVATGDMVDAFPDAELVPIAVPANSDIYRATQAPTREDQTTRILLAATNPALKRVPAMIAGVERLRSLTNKKIDIDYITDIDHVTLMDRKRAADIILDHVSPGGWGLNGCEAGAAGRPTLVRFSDPVQRIYHRTLGCGKAPTINTSDDPEAIAKALLPFVEDRDLRVESGRILRTWVEDYWSCIVRAPLLAEVLTKFANRGANVRPSSVPLCRTS